MSRPPFIKQLHAAWRANDSLLCVGIDPHIDHLPEGIRPDPVGVLQFATRIVDATAAHACAFKPQAAHFGALGAEAELARLIAYVHERYPHLPVILDAKRGDIGATAERYAVEAYERFDADAVTVNPYLGPESVQPYLSYRDRGVVILCRTSNPDSNWLQDMDADDPAYLRVARAAVDWNQDGNVMLVAGATYPQALTAVRRAAPAVPLLVPGVGTQGGDLQTALKLGRDASGLGLVINVSRAITQASRGTDFAAAATSAAAGFHAQMRAMVG